MNDPRLKEDFVHTSCYIVWISVQSVVNPVAMVQARTALAEAERVTRAEREHDAELQLIKRGEMEARLLKMSGVSD